MPAVILYGPPAAGKNTVTKALNELNDDYRMYERLKVGPGRTSGYRISEPSRIGTGKSTNLIQSRSKVAHGGGREVVQSFSK